jgi:3-deoxy-D-manno-octulosonate 8-phosphate phosphatase (KDO 8-P phosphatase)
MKELRDRGVEKRAKGIKLLMLDVDGVLTDGTIHLSASGGETKVFHARDGYGLKRLMESGIDVALISGRESRAVENRAGELGIRLVFQGVKDKKAVCRELLKQKALKRGEVASVGDDLPDLSLFAFSGVRIAVADAAGELLEAADVITDQRGGYGAVREVCEWILKLQEKWLEGIGGGDGK